VKPGHHLEPSEGKKKTAHRGTVRVEKKKIAGRKEGSTEKR